MSLEQFCAPISIMIMQRHRIEAGDGLSWRDMIASKELGETIWIKNGKVHMQQIKLRDHERKYTCRSHCD